MLMPQSHKQKKIYLGGYGGHLCEMDFDKKTLLRQVTISKRRRENSPLPSKVSVDEGDCIILKYCTRNFIATGSTNGVVNLRDPNSLQVIQRFTPHYGSLADLDINNMYLVTCGFTRKSVERTQLNDRTSLVNRIQNGSYES
jgi:hypothetical protein